MAFNQKQSQFFAKCQQVSSTLVDVVRDLEILAELWTEEFDSGSPNEIQEADLAEYGITVLQLGKIKTTSDELSNFWNNAAVTPGTYGTHMRALLNQYL